jgi:peptide/nickel transport system substrate-binding protein
MPKHILEGQDLSATGFARKPIGAGPYRMKEWDAGTSITLSASPTYFSGRPNISEVMYRVIPDMSTMFMELKANRIDMMGLSPLQYLRQTSGPKWDEQWRKYTYLSFGYTYLGYNLRHPLFQDKLARAAISYGIDRSAIIEGALLGQGEPVIGPYKPGTWPYNTSITPHGYDPEYARELLAQAGWKEKDSQGWLIRDGKRFSFTILTNQGNAQRIKTAVIIQHQLKKLGIEVRVRTIEWAAFVNEFLHKGRFEAVIMGWTIPQDPDAFDVWHSSKAEEGGLNFIGYRNAEVDAVLEKARATTDRNVRKPLYDRFQEILHSDQPYAFLYVPYSLPVVQARFHGVSPAPAGIMHNFDQWYVPRAYQRYQVTP